MKKIFLVFIIIMSFFSCGLSWVSTQTFDYNPQNAGAKITKKIIVPNWKDAYICCNNNHLYMVKNNNVSIFDLTSDETCDKINIIKSIPYDIHSLYTDTTNDKYDVEYIRGIFDYNNVLTLYLCIGKKNDAGQWIEKSTIDSFFTLSNNGTFQKSDFLLDVSNDTIVNVHYDSNNCLYTVSKKSDNDITVTKYINNNDNLEIEDTFHLSLEVKHDYSFGCYQSDFYFFYCYYNSFLSRKKNELYIFSSYKTESYSKVDLTQLGLHYKPLSVFYYKNNCWLYVRTDILKDGKHSSQYELWEIELL